MLNGEPFPIGAVKAASLYQVKIGLAIVGLVAVSVAVAPAHRFAGATPTARSAAPALGLMVKVTDFASAGKLSQTFVPLTVT